jgi:hypothetical protein
MPEPEKKIEKKSNCAALSCSGCALLLVGLLIAFFLLKNLIFFGFGDISSFFRGSGTENDLFDAAFKTSPPRKYPLDDVSKAAVERKADCKKLFLYSQNWSKEESMLCANMYTISEEEIAKAIQEKSVDRIILFGENIFFDAGTNQSAMNAKDILDSARFTDRVTLPQMMDIFGFSDLGHIGKQVSPYPAIHLRLETNDEINAGHENKSGGYAFGYFENTTDIFRMSLPKPSRVSYSRPGGSDSVLISYAWPENCLFSDAIIHEINHNFSEIKISPDNNYFFLLPNWFEEQVGSVVRTIFPEYICGAGTIKGYKSTIAGVSGEKNLIDFNSVMPPVNLYGNEPEWFKDNCQKATMVSWYRFIGKGDFRTQFRTYATEMRKATKTTNLRDENNFVSFIASLDGSAETKKFLSENGCRIK